MATKRKVRGVGLYIITTTAVDGAVDRWRETNPQQAKASAITYACGDDYASAAVDKEDGTHVGTWEHDATVAFCAQREAEQRAERRAALGGWDTLATVTDIRSRRAS